MSGAISTIPQYNPEAAKFATNSKDAEELRQDFLKMLTAQLEHQDPLEPVENTEFTAQMAQFSVLGEQQRSNELLEKILAGQSTTSMNQAVSYIGRNVVTEGNKVSVANGQGELRFDLNRTASAKVSIFDDKGALVHSFDSASYPAGENKIAIGTLPGGAKMADGNYTFEVEAFDGAAGLKVTKLTSGVVTGARNDGENGNVYLDVDGKTIALEDVRRVEQVG
ncbi:flagellar hook assembly protein FlgD [Magnetococcales bacterium HHB-1]